MTTVQFPNFFLYSTATSLLGQLQQSLTEAKQWSIKLNLNRPGKLIQGEQVSARFDVFSQDTVAGTAQKGQLSSIDVGKITPLFDAVRWARRINHVYGLRQEMPHAGIIMDAGQITFAGSVGLSAGAGRVVLPTPESMGFVIDNLNLAHGALQVFVDEGKASHEAESLRLQERRAHYEACAQKHQVTVDVLLSRQLKAAGPREILETSACMEWPIPKIIGFILDYQLKGGIEFMTDWIAERPALLKCYSSTEKQDTKEAPPLLLEVLRNEIWDDMKVNKRGQLLALLEALGKEAEPLLGRLVASFSELSAVLHPLIEQVTKKAGQDLVKEQDLELLDVLWEFSWGDRFRPFLTQLAELYGQCGEQAKDEGVRFLKEWFLTPQEIGQWVRTSVEAGNGGLLRSLHGVPAILLSLGGQRPKEVSFDDFMQETMVSRLMRSMWAIAETLHKMGAKDDSRKMVDQLSSGSKDIPNEIKTSFLIQVGGDGAREAIRRRFNAGLVQLFNRVQPPDLESRALGLFASLSQIEIDNLFQTLTEIAEAERSYHEIVKDSFKVLLMDEPFSLDPLVYFHAAKWLLSTDDAEGKTMAEQFLANHQNNHPELPQDMPSQIEKPEIRSLEAKLDHSNPYVRLEAAEALVKGRSDSGFPWLKVVEVLKKLLALPDDRRDLLSLAYDLLSSKDLAGVDRILSEPQAIRARAARALDELNPGWDREMVDQNSI